MGIVSCEIPWSECDKRCALQDAVSQYRLELGLSSAPRAPRWWGARHDDDDDDDDDIENYLAMQSVVVLLERASRCSARATRKVDLSFARMPVVLCQNAQVYCYMHCELRVSCAKCDKRCAVQDSVSQ